MSLIELAKLDERIRNHDPYANTIFNILQKYCPLAEGENLTGNETIENIVIRFINHFMLQTLNSKLEISIHQSNLRQILEGKIDENIIIAICKDHKFVSTILELETSK